MIANSWPAGEPIVFRTANGCVEQYPAPKVACGTKFEAFYEGRNRVMTVVGVTLNCRPMEFTEHKYVCTYEWQEGDNPRVKQLIESQNVRPATIFYEVADAQLLGLVSA